MLSRPRFLAWLGTSALAGCSLTTGLGGLSGGGESTGSDGGIASSSEAGGSESGAPGDATLADGGAPPLPDASSYFFRDEFNRADGPGLGGNGWTEKKPAFALFGGAAIRFNMGGGGADYRNNIAYRPDGEAVRDVEVSQQFTFLAGGGGWVQVHARVQMATVAASGVLDSYLLFRNLDVSDNRTFTVARQRGTATWVGLTSFATSVPVEVNAVHRMRLSVKGTSPVALEGIVEKQSGAGWTELGRGSASDSDASRITGPGVVGFSSGNDPSGTYQVDDFEARGL